MARKVWPKGQVPPQPARPFGPGQSESQAEAAAIGELLDQPEARILLASVALHGMLAGKSPLPRGYHERSQDERRHDAAAELAEDAVAIADAMINALSTPR